MRPLASVLCLSLVLPTALAAQTIPQREPVVPLRPPSPTTQDPTGVYEGEVPGTVVTGNPVGDYNFGTWRFEIRTRDCPDCMPGQYVLSIPNFRGMTFQRQDGSIVQETGFGSGVLNPDTGVIDLFLATSNCSAVNPTGGSIPNPGPFQIRGTYEGGGASEVPGPRVEINSIRLAGRISGRDCFNQTVRANPILFKR